jgi:hypothetical protein
LQRDSRRPVLARPTTVQEAMAKIAPLSPEPKRLGVSSVLASPGSSTHVEIIIMFRQSVKGSHLQKIKNSRVIM